MKFLHKTGSTRRDVMGDHSPHGIDDERPGDACSSRYNGGRHADEVMRLGGGW
jgi:hypothetical protein